MERAIDGEVLADAIVRNASPTLEGVMPANLFTFPGRFMCGGKTGREEVFAQRALLLDAARACQEQLAPSGICLRVLVWRGCGALIFIYRPDMLARHLSDPRVREALGREGYRTQDLESCIDRFAGRIAARGKQAAVAGAAEAHACPCDQARCAAQFPHEVGFLLGYPYADVTGFIEHGGRDYLLLGPWKVYADREGALRTFKRIRRSTERCRIRRRAGAKLRDLALAPQRF